MLIFVCIHYTLTFYTLGRRWGGGGGRGRGGRGRDFENKRHHPYQRNDKNGYGNDKSYNNNRYGNRNNGYENGKSDRYNGNSSAKGI